MPTFQELLDRHAFRAYEKQMKLSSLVGEHEWLLDVDKATVTFNKDLVFPVQFLGTESEITNTWLWADANEGVKFPDQSLVVCRKVRGIGREFGLEEFIADKFQLVEELGKPTSHTLAMVLSCLSGVSCYYRGPHENGAVYFAISDPRIDSQPELDGDGFQEMFSDLMWEPGDTKARVVSYFADKGYTAQHFDAEEVKCKLHSGDVIGFSFKRHADGGMSIGFERECL